MITYDVIVQRLRSIYDSLTCLALVVALLVLAVIITSVTLHSAYIWLVMVAAAVMLLTACSYTTCTTKSRLQDERRSVQSDDISTLSEATQTGYPNSLFASRETDLPPSYDVVMSPQQDSEPPSYSTAIVLEITSSFSTQHDLYDENHLHPADTSDYHLSDSITYVSENESFEGRTSISSGSCWSYTSEEGITNGITFTNRRISNEECPITSGIILSPSYLYDTSNKESHL